MNNSRSLLQNRAINHIIVRIALAFVNEFVCIGALNPAPPEESSVTFCFSEEPTNHRPAASPVDNGKGLDVPYMSPDKNGGLSFSGHKKLDEFFDFHWQVRSGSPDTPHVSVFGQEIIRRSGFGRQVAQEVECNPRFSLLSP